MNGRRIDISKNSDQDLSLCVYNTESIHTIRFGNRETLFSECAKIWIFNPEQWAELLGDIQEEVIESVVRPEKE